MRRVSLFFFLLTAPPSSRVLPASPPPRLLPPSFSRAHVLLVLSLPFVPSLFSPIVPSSIPLVLLSSPLYDASLSALCILSPSPLCVHTPSRKLEQPAPVDSPAAMSTSGRGRHSALSIRQTPTLHTHNSAVQHSSSVKQQIKCNNQPLIQNTLGDRLKLEQQSKAESATRSQRDRTAIRLRLRAPVDVTNIRRTDNKMSA